MQHDNFVLSLIGSAIMEHFHCPQLPVHVELTASGHAVFIAKRDAGVSVAVHSDPSEADSIWVSGRNGILTIGCSEDSMILYCKLPGASPWQRLELLDPAMFDRLWSLVNQLSAITN